MKTCHWMVMAGCCVLLLGGCGGGEDEPAGPTSAPAAPEAQGGALDEATSAVGDVTGQVAEQAQEVAEEVQETAEEAAARARAELETFQRDQMRQLEQHQSAFDTLAATATGLGDEQLAGLLGAMDIKLADVRNKLSEILTADEGTIEALRGEITTLMEEIPRLLAQASERFESLKPPIETPDLPPIGGAPEK